MSVLANLLEKIRDPEDRGRLVLLAAMACYVVFVITLLSQGSFAFFPKEVVLPVIFVPPILSRRFRRFVHDWCVFLAVIVLFDYLRGLVFDINVFLERMPYAEYVIKIDRALLGGEVMPVLLQRHFYDGIGSFEKFLTVIHASHFAMLFLVGIVIWYWRREHFRRFSIAMLLVVYIGLLIYLLVPTVPPWMADSYFGLIPDVVPFHRQVYNTALPYIASGFDSNPVAAMPSLHAAIPTLMTAVSFHHFRARNAAIVAVYTFFVYLSILFSAEHYLIDVLAGMLLAGVVYAALYHTRLRRRFLDLPLDVKAFRGRLLLTALVVIITVLVARAQNQLSEMWEDELRGTQEAIAELLNYGHQAFEAGDYNEAVKALSNVPINRHSPRSIDLMASALLELGRDDEAEALFDSAFRSHPGGADILVVVKTAVLYRYKRIDRAGVETAIRRLEAMPGSRAQDAANKLREMLKSRE